jgi:predicted amidophosphoribosyltransferase
MGWIRVLEVLGLKEKAPTKVRNFFIGNELGVFSLKGKFFYGFSLDVHRTSLESEHKRTQIGELVYRFKYKYEKGSGLILADLVEKAIREREELNSAEKILTVPPSFTSRPFDPVSFLTEEVSIRVGIPHFKNIIRRVRLTKLQKKVLDKKSKMENVRSAFRLTNTDVIDSRTVLLIDDICDSGSTLDEITLLLKQGGTKNVIALTLTKTSWGQR